MSHEEAVLVKLEYIESFIKDHIKDHCKTCTNTSTFRERLRSQWTHILGLWAATAGLFAYFYQHVTGK